MGSIAAAVSREAQRRTQAMHRLARRWQRLGRWIEARDGYLQVLSRDPERVTTLNNLSVLEMCRGDLMQAQLWLDRAFRLLQQHKLNPKTVSGWQLALNSSCQLALQQRDFAAAHQRGAALVLLESTPRPLTNLAVALAMDHRPAAALRAQALALGVELAEVGTQVDANLPPQLGRLLWQPMETPAASAQRHRQLLNLATFALQANPRLTWGWRLLLASLGSDAEAWKGAGRPWQRLWNGAPTQELLLWDEQGYGDCLQNLRWLPAAALRAQQLEVQLRPELLRLVEQRLPLPPHCRLRSLKADRPPWHGGSSAHLPITGLAGVLSQGQLQLSGRPYLKHAPCDGAHRRRDSALRVGFAWAAGSKADPEARRAAILRSVPANMFLNWIEALQSELAPQISQPIHWLSLQVGLDASESRGRLEALGIDTLPPGGDWQDTADAMTGMSAVVSVDTAVAHLGGALGQPTVVLLNTPCDWRWGQQGSQIDWYDSWHVVRCQHCDGWEQTLARAGFVLREILLSVTRPLP